MTDIRRKQKLVETTDPATGKTIYRDETTGEIVTPDWAATPATPSNVPEAPAPVPGQQYSERTVTQASDPVTGSQVVEQRSVNQGPGVAPAGNLHTQESAVVTEDPFAPRRARIFKVQQAIYLIFGIIEGLLAIRFVLRLLGANPSSGFASFIYSITAPFMAPFNNVFGQPSFQGSVVETNALIAIVVYALLAWVLVKIAWLVGGETRSGTRTSEVHRRTDQ